MAGAGALAALVIVIVLTARPAVPPGLLPRPQDTPPLPESTLHLSPVRAIVPDGQDHFETDFEVTNLSPDARLVTARLVEQNASGVALPSSEASADRWVRVAPASALLDHQQAQRFHVTVDAPATRENGERRVGVVFTVEPPPGAAQLKFVLSVVAPVLIPGHGQIIRGLSLGPVSSPLVADWAPISFSVPVSNRGNVHRDLEGMDSGLVASTSSGEHFAMASGTVLPASSLVVTGVWTHPPPLCWCEIAVSTDDGNGRQLVVRTHVLVLPLRGVLGLAVIGVGLLIASGALRFSRGRAR